MAGRVSCTETMVKFDPDGDEALPAIPYGDEREVLFGFTFDREDAPLRDQTADYCHDCYTPKGGTHHPGCDSEQCPKCGFQLISCGCLHDVSEDDEDDEEEEDEMSYPLHQNRSATFADLRAAISINATPYPAMSIGRRLVASGEIEPYDDRLSALDGNVRRWVLHQSHDVGLGLALEMADFFFRPKATPLTPFDLYIDRERDWRDISAAHSAYEEQVLPGGRRRHRLTWLSLRDRAPVADKNENWSDGPAPQSPLIKRMLQPALAETARWSVP